MLNAQTLEQQLRQLLLPCFAKRYIDLATQCESTHKSHIDYLSLLAQEEVEHRQRQRIARLLKEARLPRNKHLADFEVKRIPDLSLALLQTLAEGREDLRQRLLKEAPKFGNDDDYVDLLLKEVQHRTQKEVAKIVGYWDIPYTIDGSIAGAYYPWGRKIGAFPNGRMAKETLADGSLSPYPDWSTSGPTAVIKSMSKVKPVFAELANQRFMPQFLEGENKEQFAAYLKTWSDMGNYHIQFNVVNDEELHDAQEHPENHANLTVRVAGYSAYFVDLSKGVQDEIIKRVSQSF